MGGYNVAVDLGPLLAANSVIAESIFALAGQAVRAVAEEGYLRWRDAVWKARLWEGEKSPYYESIRWRMVGPMSAEIWSDYPLAAEIDDGRPARDLKRVLQTSKRVRVAGPDSKHPGQKYLIIPFRHNTPGGSGQGALAPQMPPSIYAEAKLLSFSKIVGETLRVSGQVKQANQARWSAVAASRSARGAGPGKSTFLVPQHVYSWGSRLPAGLAPKLKDSHVTDPYAGMVRFKTSTPGGGKSSAYLTFRVMGEWSSGWVVGPKPGLGIVKKVADQLQPLLNDAIGGAVTLGSLRR